MSDLRLKPPKGQKIWVQYPLESGFYVLTSNERDRSKYFLYKITDKKWEKIAQSTSVPNLEKRILGGNGR